MTVFPVDTGNDGRRSLGNDAGGKVYEARDAGANEFLVKPITCAACSTASPGIHAPRDFRAVKTTSAPTAAATIPVARALGVEGAIRN